MATSFALPLAIVAVVFVLAGVPAFFSEAYADAAVVLSNLIYALPILVSYYANMFDFVLVILICALFSIFYHSCKSYDVCFHLGERAWESIDVSYSWFLLLTLASYFALGKRFLHAAPVHVALIVWGSFAHCKDNYDCRSYKAIVVGIYFAFVIMRWIRNTQLYDVVDVVTAMVFFLVAANIYLFFNSLAGHTMWHIVSGIGVCFLITAFRESKFHTLGFRKPRMAYRTILRRDDL
jgi:hypothetical protein